MKTDCLGLCPRFYYAHQKQKFYERTRHQDYDSPICLDYKKSEKNPSVIYFHFGIECWVSQGYTKQAKVEIKKIA